MSSIAVSSRPVKTKHNVGKDATKALCELHANNELAIKKAKEVLLSLWKPKNMTKKYVKF